MCIRDRIWGAAERVPGFLIRVDRGKNPPQSCMTEVYKVPAPGLDPRGLDVDRNGVVWTALAASSHLASFDRRKCKSLTGARKTDGSDCPEGWTLYLTDGPKLKGTNIPSDFHYYNLSLIHISEPTRLLSISYAVFCLKKKKKI